MPLTFPDYHAEAPGGAQGGRSMVTRPFDGHELGPHIKDLGSPLPELTVFGMMLGSGKEIIHFMRATKSLASALYVAKRLSKHAIDVMRHGRGMTLTNGNALAGRLAKSAFDLNIPLWLSSPVRELIVEDGAVRGAIVERDGRRFASTPSAAWCSPAAAFRTMSRGARRCFRMRRRHRAFLAGPCRQHRRRLAAGGIRRRPRRGYAAERRGLGAGLDHRRARTAARA